MAARRTNRAKLPALTARDLKQRAKASGINLPEDEIEPTLMLMNNALEALADFESTGEHTREPAVVFRP